MKAITTLFALLFLVSFDFQAQTQGIAYPAVGKGVATTFVTDYHSLGVNSSSLGWGNEYDKKFTMGTTEFNLGIYSDSLDSKKLRQLFKSIRQSATGNNSDNADWETQRQYAQDYVNSGVALDMNFNWLGFSYQTEKFGGIAFNISENYSWYSRLNDNTADLIFNGSTGNYFDSLTVVFGNDTSNIANNGSFSEDTLNAIIAGTSNNPLSLSQFTNGTDIRFTWNRYYNFGYGRKVFGDREKLAVYAGIGGRYIQSLAMFNVKSDGNDFYVHSSFSPSYDINYGAAANTNPSAFTQSGNIPKPVGSGYGIDLSVSAILFDKLKLAAAVNNIGSVTYTRNVYSANDSSLLTRMELGGLESYDLTDAVYNLLGDGGIMEVVGEEKYTLRNAATYRFGASIQLGKIAHFGMDIVGPFNQDNPGSLTNPILSLGGEVRVVKWLHLSVGYLGGGIYKHNVPVGVNFVLGEGTYEFGISSRDALTFFLNGSNSISSAFGFARVRF